MINVVIVMARCSRDKLSFGIRLEEKSPRQWTADWAFAVKETLAKKEGYGRNEIRGAFLLDGAYPGCPYCKVKGFVKCGCGKVACWDSERTTVTCPWCGDTSAIGGQIEGLAAGGDA